MSWTLTEKSLRERERAARKAAVAEARAVAEEYAEALSHRIERVVSISDVVPEGPGMPTPRFAAMAAEAGPAEVTIAEITVSASVTGVFETA